MTKKFPTVLVVEDEELLATSIIKKMEKSQISVVTVSSGEAALEYLKTSDLPDLIWLDYYLEGDMTGLDFIEQAHQNPAWSKIPVIVVSNSATKDKVDQMLKLGARKYFLKAEHLLSEIIEFILSIVENPETKKQNHDSTPDL